MNIVKLYTSDGPIYVDTDQMNKGRTLLTIYTANGRKLKEAGRTKAIRERAQYGVHRDNLFASLELAVADRERTYAMLFAEQQKQAA